MSESLEWIAMGTGIVAAIMVSADLGRRITGFAFIVFAVSSTCWVVIGLSDDEAPLMYQNIVLTVINFIGIYARPSTKSLTIMMTRSQA